MSCAVNAMKYTEIPQGNQVLHRNPNKWWHSFVLQSYSFRRIPLYWYTVWSHVVAVRTYKWNTRIQCTHISLTCFVFFLLRFILVCAAAAAAAMSGVATTCPHTQSAASVVCFKVIIQQASRMSLCAIHSSFSVRRCGARALACPRCCRSCLACNKFIKV